MMKVKTKNIFLVVLSMLFVLTFGCFFVSISAKAQGTTPVTDIVMLEKASVRKEADKSGIRYTAYVNEKHFENGALKDGYKAGVIVTEGQVSANTLTLASNETGGAYAGKVLDIPTTIWDAEKDSKDGKAFNAVVWNIPDTAYGNYLTARAYLFNGTDYIYSDAVCVRNVAQVASEALADGVEDTWGTLVKYVDGVNPTITVAGNAETTMAVEKEVGANLSISVTPSYLTPIIETENKFVSVTDSKMIVRKYDANNTVETVTIKLGSTTKTVQITAKNEFKDGNLAENVLADFDENYYPSYGIKVGTASQPQYVGINYVDVETAKAAGVEADSGVVKVYQYSHTDTVVIPFGKTLTVSEISGIYLKIWVNENAATTNNIGIKLSNGNFLRVSNEASVQGFNLVANSWNYIYMARKRFQNFGMTSVSQIEMYVQGSNGAANAYYIDEVGLLDNIVQENELINFDNPADIQTTYPWSSNTISYLSATDSTVPAGATGGVAKIVATGGAEAIIYFKRMLNTSQVSTIIVRAYISSSNPMRWWSVNKTGGYSGSNWTITAQSGQFYDYKIDVATQWGTTDNSVCAIRLHPNSADTWYIDSITYVAK